MCWVWGTFVLVLGYDEECSFKKYTSHRTTWLGLDSKQNKHGSHSYVRWKKIKWGRRPFFTKWWGKLHGR
jgi:hypothetical protein